METTLLKHVHHAVLLLLLGLILKQDYAITHAQQHQTLHILKTLATLV
jgi:hypothetical protein